MRFYYYHDYFLKNKTQTRKLAGLVRNIHAVPKDVLLLKVSFSQLSLRYCNYCDLVEFLRGLLFNLFTTIFICRCSEFLKLNQVATDSKDEGKEKERYQQINRYKKNIFGNF